MVDVDWNLCTWRFTNGSHGSTRAGGLRELSTTEQIRNIQALWDRVAERGSDVAVPDSALEIAEERLAIFRQDPTRVEFAYTVLNRLLQSSGTLL
jgi:trimethylamine:corrinoid methyltransferase-like protein